MCPFKRFKQREVLKPWLTPEIYHEIRYQEKCLNLFRCTGSQHYFKLACKSRNKINVLVDKAISNYFRDTLRDNAKNPKKFWRIIKNFTDNDLDQNAGSNFVDPITLVSIPPIETPDFLNHCLVISSRTKLKAIDRNLVLHISNQTLEFVDKYNYLGFWLDSEMTLKPLLSNVKKITTGKIKTLDKIRRYLNKDSALAIYKQMILPLFDYSGFLLLSCYKTDREDLQVIQNNALRLCLDIKLNDRISLIEIHKKANLISLEQRRCVQLLCLLYQHGELNVNVFVIPARNTRAVHIRKFKTEIYRNSKYKNSPYFKAAKFWDTLPRPSKDSQTIGELKRHLRDLFPLFDETFYLT